MNVQNTTNHELALNSIAIISAELETLYQGAGHLHSIYKKAAISSDLTFIKILEEKYDNLTTEFSKLGKVVSDVKVNLAIISMGGE